MKDRCARSEHELGSLIVARSLILIKAIALAACVTLTAQLTHAQNAVPDECLKAVEQPSADSSLWKLCWEIAEPQSNPWYLATINLGTAALYEDDFEEAAKYYLLTVVPETRIDSDVVLHAHRASVFRRTGNLAKANYDAERAWDFVKNGKFGLGERGLSDSDQFYVLLHVLEALKVTDSLDFDAALKHFKALTISDVYDQANRVAVLSDVGDIEAAILESAVVLLALPNEPAVLNNHCDMLTRAGRGAEGLPFCEKAVAQNPDIAAIQHSLAMAMAAVGRCDEARAAMTKGATMQPSAVIFQEALSCEFKEDK